MTHPQRSLDLIALGECMVELHADGPLGDAAQLTRACGGDTLNALVSAARLGSRCGFISRVGSDPFGHGLRRAWQAEGIDVTHAPLVDGENGVYFISLHAGGEREFTYRRAGSAATHLSPADVDAAYVAASRTLLLSGITQAISGSAQAATRHAAQLARQCGTRVAFDPNHRPRLWAVRGGLDAARAALHELLPCVDLLLPSFPVDAALLDHTPSDAPGAARAFAALDVTVALKDGPHGAWLCEPGGEPLHVPAPPVPDVLDTTGAGDAWNGAFLHALTRAQPPEQAARTAHASAAHVIRHRGALPPPPAHSSPHPETA
ncbi:2-dehydro-3-deoxygluconokinase [Deinococcus seoulensis]|uniref:2-dehydro-3-deoxygluconokinase n=1 Tax=Deinococcus seoulensis TaxID=1837379 RepID=A0ABQ2RRQ2_9DEIO|nr:sugar kinase [Deinococcus seoulensis]GGR59011.1 2-dehydro-3-deoxygluconokinase [Deinococcus seoulensis]